MSGIEDKSDVARRVTCVIGGFGPPAQKAVE